MPFIIDGYNLLFAIGIAPSERAESRVLQRARSELLNFLAASLPPAEVRTTIVVFDAADAPRGLRTTFQYRGLSVRFAFGFASGDELIELLIRETPAPRQLTVVSSDHRIQLAARRRRATAIDSEPWYESVRRDSRRRLRPTEPLAEPLSGSETPPRDHPQRKHGPTDRAEVEYWLRAFEADDADPGLGEDVDTIFPPGYAEDEGLGEDR